MSTTPRSALTRRGWLDPITWPQEAAVMRTTLVILLTLLPDWPLGRLPSSS